MGLEECNTVEGLKALIERLLCASHEPLESMDLLGKLAGVCGREPNRVLFRKALAELVRSGRIERVSGEEYGRARMLFRCKGLPG